MIPYSSRFPSGVTTPRTALSQFLREFRESHGVTWCLWTARAPRRTPWALFGAWCRNKRSLLVPRFLSARGGRPTTCTTAAVALVVPNQVCIFEFNPSNPPAHAHAHAHACACACARPAKRPPHTRTHTQRERHTHTHKHRMTHTCTHARAAPRHPRQKQKRKLKHRESLARKPSLKLKAPSATGPTVKYQPFT